MDTYILDTSVVVKWYVTETNSDKANQLLDRFLHHALELVAPDVITLELVNALKFGAHYSNSDLVKAVNYFYQLNLILIGTNQALIIKTVNLLNQPSLAAYDAYFIALANELQLPLITCDIKHHQQSVFPLIRYLNEI